MKLNIFTLCLDSAPFLGALFTNINRLSIPFHWVIVQGAAMKEGCTSWMNGQAPRLSEDGTHEFLMDLAHHPRISVISRPLWHGKVEMCNAAMQMFTEPGVLLQADSDEIWTTEQMEKMVNIFEKDPLIFGIMMYCRYFIGPNIITTSTNGFGNRNTEWRRCWRYVPGMKFSKHEPPVLDGNNGIWMSRESSLARLGYLDHYAYATSKQALAKQILYGDDYSNALQQWESLQVAQMPVKNLQQFLPWVGPNASADALYK